MNIYLNENKLNEEYESLTFPNLLDSIKDDGNSIVKKIYINDVEVNERYLEKISLEKKDIKSIKFVTQQTKDLIIETLEEVDDYLPKLKNGILKTADHFRNGELKEGNNKYQYIIKGLEWYIGVIKKILSIIDNKDLYTKGQELINSLNSPLTDVMIAYNKEDIILLADMLEYEVADYIDKFIELNNQIELN